MSTNDDPFSDLISSIDNLRIRDPTQVPDDISPEDDLDQLAISSQPYMSEADILSKIRGDETSVVIEDNDDDIEVVNEEVPSKTSAAEIREAMFTGNQNLKSHVIKFSESFESAQRKSASQYVIISFFK